MPLIARRREPSHRAVDVRERLSVSAAKMAELLAVAARA